MAEENSVLAVRSTASTAEGLEARHASFNHRVSVSGSLIPLAIRPADAHAWLTGHPRRGARRVSTS